MFPLPPDPPILHADPRFVIIDKPAGMLSVPGKGPDKADCAISRVRAIFPHARGPMVVHRLDMDTSGLLLIALNPASQRELSRQFEHRLTSKRYIALLEGSVTYDAGEITVPLRPDIDNRPHQIADLVHGREAITRYRVLAREIDRTRVEFEPITGRSHQLRVHAALPRLFIGPRPGGLGCPIVGDVLYGTPAERLMLHASRLEILDPDTGARLCFESPAPF
jgi:tRNA pseudouridine32 synthase/23S rRNA pseudouridine746 synthase